MGVTQLQVRIPRKNGIPADDVVNVFHLGHAAAELDGGGIADVIEAFAKFYAVDTPVEGKAVAGFFANYMDLGAAEMRFYNPADPKPRLPYHTEPVNLFTEREGALDLPGEVAVCFSHRAPYVTGENPQRRRGRVYLGCLNTAAIGPPVGFVVPVHQDFRETIREAAQRLIVDLAPTEFGVYSRGQGTIDQGSTTPTATADWAPFFAKSEFGHVDDAFDTQRRRGADSASRLTFDL